MPRSKRRAEAILGATWRGRGPIACLLLPVAAVFKLLVALRRAAYRLGWLHSDRLPVAVIIVGGIVAGGSGKTPLALRIAEGLRDAGRQPGLVSRGYGGSAGTVREVEADSDPDQVGDEPLLLKRRFCGPVFVGRNRALAARALLAAHPQCDLIISDDGLQHYALARDVEIVVTDDRGIMNGWPLPAGPLREPVDRIVATDALVLNGVADEFPLRHERTFEMKLVGESFYLRNDPAHRVDASAFNALRLHAVAGIGNPQRFFEHLRALGLDPATHAFPDHHRYQAGDLEFAGDAIVTTEKDAVKFGSLARLPVWVLPVTAQVRPDIARFLLEILDGRPIA